MSMELDLDLFWFKTSEIQLGLKFAFVRFFLHLFLVFDYEYVCWYCCGAKYLEVILITSKYFGVPTLSFLKNIFYGKVSF